MKIHECNNYNEISIKEIEIGKILYRYEAGLVIVLGDVACPYGT